MDAAGIESLAGLIKISGWQHYVGLRCLEKRITPEQLFADAGFADHLAAVMADDSGVLPVCKPFEAEAERLGVPVEVIKLLRKQPPRVFFHPLAVPNVAKAERCSVCKVDFVDGEEVVRNEGGRFYHPPCSKARNEKMAEKQQRPARNDSVRFDRGRVINKGTTFS